MADLSVRPHLGAQRGRRLRGDARVLVEAADETTRVTVPGRLAEDESTATSRPVTPGRKRGGGWLRPIGRGRNAVAVLAAAATVLPSWGAGASAQSLSPALANPPANIPRTQVMDEACQVGPGLACQQAVVAAIDSARSAEGVGLLELPSDYDSLTVAQQLLVLADLERVDRGLPGFVGLSSQLDAMAQAGAAANNDPAGPSGTAWGSNWAGGEATALLADYDWMYDDGLGSPNLDCGQSQLASGCWDHRDNILGNYGPHPSMGAAEAIVNGVTSMTEIMSSAPPQPLAFALPEAPAHLAGPRSIGTAYLQTASNGAVATYGGAGFFGSAARIHLAKPIVGIQAWPGGTGYWEVAADGGVFSFGHARFYGSAAPFHLSHKVVGMAVADGGKGYWLATTSGGVYSFGHAKFYGTPERHIRLGVVGIVPTRNGQGYWLATKDGAVYSFGDAKFYGPRRRLHLTSPIVGMAATHGGRGYWLVTKDGRVYAFGDAKAYGPVPIGAFSRVVGIAAPREGRGYYVALHDGRVLAFGGASLAARERHFAPSAVVGIAAV